jgi:hypothetical protein
MKFIGCFSAAALVALSLPSCFSFQTSSTSLWGRMARTHENSVESFRLASTSARAKPGTAKLDTPWEELGFEFRETNSHVKITYKDGEWGEAELVKVGAFLINLSYSLLGKALKCGLKLTAFSSSFCDGDCSQC